ncbi:MAG: hypothetical protein PHE84_09880 [bacterium]|nr:hypothetical protein [bacterium]
MKRESEKAVKKLVLTLVLLLGGAIGPGNVQAQTSATIVDKSEITKTFSQIVEVETFLKNLSAKAKEKGDVAVQDCLSNILLNAEKMKPQAQGAMDKALSGLNNKPEPDLVKAGDGISVLAALRENFRGLFGQALTCLSTVGNKKNWKEDLVNLLKPMITFTDEELLNLPEPSLQPTPWLSIYR